MIYLNSFLGKKVAYKDQLDASLLFFIPRENNRNKIGVSEKSLPFVGYDLWNCYEFCWLDQQSYPVNKFLEICVPSDSDMLIESKSLKLYLFSYANTKFDSIDSVIKQLQTDLSVCINKQTNKQTNKKIKIKLTDFANNKALIFKPGFSASSLDNLDISCDDFEVNPLLLCCDINSTNSTNSTEIISENLCSDLLKSNCLVTGKPDWASVRIQYTGVKISHAGLLKYIISFREHQGFHEDCVERIFVDIMARCKPEKLIIEARYTRRGGLDINPVRANHLIEIDNCRLFRQ